MNDWSDLYNQLARIGFPPVLLYGLWKGWWFLKPQVTSLIEQVAELTKDLKESRSQTASSITLAEESHKLTAAAISEVHDMQIVTKETRELVEQLLEAITAPRRD